MYVFQEDREMYVWRIDIFFRDNCGNCGKIIDKDIWISTWFVVMEPLEDKLFGIPEDRFLMIFFLSKYF